MPQPHTTAILLASGDEILTGQLLDTNTRWLAEQLVNLGIMPIELNAAPDDLPRLVNMIRRAAAQAPLIILSGGLGPTDGDLTRQALAEVLNEPLVLDNRAEQAITTYLTSRNRQTTPRQLRQAHRPQSATCLPNLTGTAPGLYVQLAAPSHLTSDIPHPTSDIFALPGPPGELRPMFAREVLPRLRPDPARTIATRLLHVVAMPEADCVDRLGTLTKRARTPGVPLVGITASGGILTIRIRYEGPGPRDIAERAIDESESLARAALKDHLLPFAEVPESTGAAALTRNILSTLTQSHQTLATIESCTGGMLGEMLTSIPGSSSAYLGGFITYANALKESLGVDPALIQTHGAVSPQVAQAMAAAGLQRTPATHTLAITGIAGPDGGTPTKPVGTVHIALGTPALRAGSSISAPTVHSRHFLFTGDREDIRRRAATSALTMLYFALKGHAPGTPRLLWQVDS